MDRVDSRQTCLFCSREEKVVPAVFLAPMHTDGTLDKPAAWHPVCVIHLVHWFDDVDDELLLPYFVISSGNVHSAAIKKRRMEAAMPYDHAVPQPWADSVCMVTGIYPPSHVVWSYKDEGATVMGLPVAVTPIGDYALMKYTAAGYMIAQILNAEQHAQRLEARAQAELRKTI